MNIILTLSLLIMAVLALHHNALVLYGALVLAAVIASPRAWLYTLAVAIGVFLLKFISFPSWQPLAFALIGIAYGLMSRLEVKKEESIPPELLYYMMGGGRVAP